MQVTQPAFAVLDVGLDQVARLAAAAMTLFALHKLGGDEFGGAALHDLPVEPRHHLVEQGTVAEQKPRLQEGSADRHVRLRLADALVDRPRRMADFESHVPQAVEDDLGDLLAPGGLLVGKQEQKIDVRARRHQAAAVAAGRHDRHPFAFRGALRRIKLGHREGVDHPNEVILHPGEPRCTAAALAFLQQQRFGLRGTFCEHCLEALSNGGPFLALDGGCELLHLGDERVGVEECIWFMRRRSRGHASSDTRSFTPCHGS